jgi:hypothetical protein
VSNLCTVKSLKKTFDRVSATQMNIIDPNLR